MRQRTVPWNGVVAWEANFDGAELDVIRAALLRFGDGLEHELEIAFGPSETS